MAIERRTRIIWSTVVVLAAILLATLLLPIQLCRDFAYVCENTGSLRGYREWVWGTKARAWYKQSAVEAFMQQNFPDELEHRWTSWEGTGRNVYGMAVVRGHGRPGAIFQIDIYSLGDWFQSRSIAEKKAFYDLLVSNDQNAIKKEIHGILEELIQRSSE